MAIIQDAIFPLEQLVFAALGGVVGACLRVALRDEVVARGYASWRATLAVNVVGCAIALACMGLAIGTNMWALIVAGALGGFTTFSAFAIETIALWMARGNATRGKKSVASTNIPLPTRRVPHYLRGFAAIVLGAIVGCTLRTWLDLTWVAKGHPMWQATLAVNVTGSLVAGVAFRFLHAVAADGAPVRSPLHRLILERATIFGFAGGLTSMSAVATDVASAAEQGVGLVALILALNFVLGISAAGLGWWAASLVAVHRPPWETLVTAPRSTRHE